MGFKVFLMQNQRMCFIIRCPTICCHTGSHEQVQLIGRGEELMLDYTHKVDYEKEFKCKCDVEQPVIIHVNIKVLFS